MRDDYASSELGCQGLHARGLPTEPIHLVMRDKSAQGHSAVHDGIETKVATKAAQSAGIGACVGGTLGVVAAAIAAGGISIVLPGIGLEAAGPVTGVIAAAGLGAASGGLLGVLIGLGTPKESGKHERWVPASAKLMPIVNPAAEECYWREAYRREPYFQHGRTYDDYAQAYRLGYLGRACKAGAFDDAESALNFEWNCVKDRSSLSWNEARQASRAAWNHAA